MANCETEIGRSEPQKGARVLGCSQRRRVMHRDLLDLESGRVQTELESGVQF